MLKNQIKLKYIFLVLPVIILSLGMVSCDNDDDGGGGVPVIEYIRVPDPAKADSTFVKGSPGQIIAIIGQNLGGATHLYINDQGVYFNPTMNTNHSIMVTLPSEEDGFVLAANDPDLKAEIRVETPGGTATYSFRVLAPYPSLQRLAGRFPRQTGDEMKLYGMNLLDIERVYFTDADPYEAPEIGEDGEEIEPPIGNEIDVETYSMEQDRYLDPRTNSYVTSSIMTFTLPNIPYEDGWLMVECAAGTVNNIYAKLPPPPTVTRVSSDMPIPGSRITVYGTNFIAVEAVKYGNVTVPAAELTVAESEDMISLIFPSRPATTTELTVVTAGGEASMPFHNYETLLINFDDRGHDLGWGPNASYYVADGTEPPYVSDRTYARIQTIDNGSNWWGMMIYWTVDAAHTPFTLPSYDLIPAATPASEVYFAYECYNSIPFDGSSFMHYQFQTQSGGTILYENFDWGIGGPPNVVLPNYDGDAEFDTWYTVMVPMSRFDAFAGKTYKDIVDSTITTIRLMDMNWGTTPQVWDVCVDNIRIITK